MSDNENIGNGQQHTAWVRAFRADGWQVNFTFALDAADPIGHANTMIAALAEHGYTPNAPGMKPGEHRESVGAVVRYNKRNDDGSMSPRIYFFSNDAKLVHKLVDTYLDTPEQRAEFERVSGLELSSLPVWQTKAAPQRDEAENAGVLVAVKKPFSVIFVDNPDYNPAETDITKKKPKFTFARYEPDTPVTPAANVTAFPTSAATPSAAPTASTESGASGDGAHAELERVFPATVEPHWTQDAEFVKGLFERSKQAFNMGTPQVLKALNVKTITLYKGTKDEAYAAIKAHAVTLKEAS